MNLNKLGNVINTKKSWPEPVWFGSLEKWRLWWFDEILNGGDSQETRTSVNGGYSDNFGLVETDDVIVCEWSQGLFAKL